MRRLLFLLAVFVLLFSGCKDEMSPPTEKEIMAIYDHYLQGDYAQYVDAMHSCRNKPAAYRDQMLLLHKQHAAEQKRANGGAKSATVERIEMHDSGRMANVFLNITYANQSSEEIILPMVYADGDWYVR